MDRLSTIVGVGVVLTCLAAGCATIDPYTRETQTSKVVRGPGIGAAAGAVAGLLTKGDKLQNALIGAGAVALDGGAVDYYMDSQEARLRQKLKGTGVSVTRVGDKITLNLPGSITFASNSADMSSRFCDALGGVAVVLKEYHKTVIEVAGYTDSTGSDRHNQQLSRHRSTAVAGYLSGQGIDPRRLLTVGAGESYPVASNDTEAGRARNRRVELTIVPLTMH